MRVVVSEHVYTETINDETVLLELESGRYYGLDAVGTRLWQLLNELGSIEAVTQSAVAEFEVEPAQLARDLAVLVRELAARKLVTVHAPTDSTAGQA